MKNKKGLTLVEIVVAIALLGIISVMLFPALTNQYALMRKTRVMTADLYTAQQEIELVISDVKKGIQSGTMPEGQTRTSYTIFNGKPYVRTIDGYPNQIAVHVGNNAINLNTIVADNLMPEFPVATVTNVEIQFYDDDSTISNAYVETDSLHAVATYDLQDPENVNLTNIYRWYVSREGFNSPMIAAPLEIESGTTYPRFPEDYVLIAGASSKTLASIPAGYAGKHLIFTVTPASESGKMGATVPSNPLYISGLPVLGNLRLHLDASMMSREDPLVRTASGRMYVTQWNDISGLGNNARKISTTDLSKQPELIETKTGEGSSGGIYYESYAKYVRFSGGQGLTVPDIASLDLNDMTVFVVAKSADKVSQKTIVSKINTTTGWFLGWNTSPTNNQLGLLIRNSSGINSVSANPDVALDNEWHVLTGSSALAFQADSGTTYTLPRTVTPDITNSSPISIGYNGSTSYSNVDIAEILIYNTVLSPADANKIATYLTNKYQPPTPELTIYALRPMTDSVFVGDTYTLPVRVSAIMSNGSLRDVAVVWTPATPNPIDTSTEGMQTFVATALADPSKTTTLQVEVSSRRVTGVTLSPSTLALSIGNTSQLTASVIPANASNKNVTFASSNVGIASVSASGLVTAVADGTATITVTTEDGGFTATCAVTVRTPVTGVTLNDYAQTVAPNASYTLIATVLPPTATDKRVTWSSSNTAVATVVDGVVTVRNISGGGYSDITVTTVEGGFTATCRITASVPCTGVTLNSSTLNIRRNRTFNLNETVSPANATDKTVTWTSSNPAIATVDSTGLVRGISVGTATITVRTNDGGFTATCLATIRN